MLSLLLWLLKRKKTSTEDRTRILNTLLTVSELPPLHGIIREEGSQLFIKESPVPVEERIFLADAADQALNNQARKLVLEQMRFEATKYVLQNATSMEPVLFGKAAIWVIEKEQEMLTNLRGTQ